MPALRLNRLVAQVVAGSAVPDVTGKIKQMSVRPPLDSKNPIKYVGGDKVTFYGRSHDYFSLVSVSRVVRRDSSWRPRMRTAMMRLVRLLCCCASGHIK